MISPTRRVSINMSALLHLAGLFVHRALARWRRVKGVTSTRLPASGHCHVHVAILHSDKRDRKDPCSAASRNASFPSEEML
jgi:hypothetical protein